MSLPIARDSSPDPVSVGFSGPVTMTLASPSSGTQQVTLTIDSAWLHDPGRVFPVSLDLPIVTSLAAWHSGRFGTVSSCAPSTRAPLARMVVGVTNGCTYRGVTYFEVGSIDPGAIVQSATLNLYTPGKVGPTGAQVYANAPIAEMPSWQTPSWSTAPAMSRGSTGIGQSGNNGSWQSWDVTGLVQGWVQNRGTNGGLTLVGTGAPVLVASPLGAGDDAPALAPYLEITYAPPAPMPAKVSAGLARAVASSTHRALASLPRQSPKGFVPSYGVIYGMAGEFALNSECPSSTYLVCSVQRSNQTRTLVPTRAVQNGQSDSPPGVRGSYMRFAKVLPCPPTPSQTPTVPGPTFYDNNSNLLENTLKDAHAAGLIPIVVFNEDGGCATGGITGGYSALYDQIYYGTRTYWYQYMADFVTWLYSKGFAKNGDANQLPFMEIEIQNEPNNPSANSYQFLYYASKFGQASGALYSYFGANGYGEDHYLILTGGVAAPQAQATNTNASGCFNNLRIIHDAIEAAYANGVPVRNYKASPPQAPMVGMALHPYSYITSPITDTGYWQNYSPAHPYGNACRDLGDTLNRWKAGVAPH